MSRQAGKHTPSDGAWRINGLGADGPFPALKKQLQLFGQFVGDWDILENRYLQKDGTWTQSRGELHWAWILEGKALQDVWMSIDEKTGKAIPAGTTVRFYDPKIDAWRSTWISPSQGVVRPFLARQVGDEIVLEATADDGHPIKWIFSKITSGSFRWRAEERRGNGDSWTVTEEMRIRRRS